MWQRLLSLFKKKRSRSASGTSVTDIFKKKYFNFKSILESNSELLKIISDFEEKLGENRVFSVAYIRSQTSRVIFHTARIIKSFEQLSGHSYPSFAQTLDQIIGVITVQLEQKTVPATSEFVLPYSDLNKEMVHAAGGKNANLGELTSRLHIPIPKGFAITTAAFQAIVSANDLIDEIRMQKMAINTEDPETIHQVSENIQRLFMQAAVPEPVEQAILNAYDRFVGEGKRIHVALRSSAIGEDSDLSFAGQYLTVLNVPPDLIIKEYLRVLASLFTPRAIFYLLYMGIPFGEADMGVGCLEMVQARASGVIYTASPYDALDKNILINALWGLGTSVVDGMATPDIYKVSREPGHPLISTEIANKPKRMGLLPDGFVAEQSVEKELQNQACVSPEQAALLAGYAVRLENHYERPQDIAWAIDTNGQAIILQARPLRVEGNKSNAASLPKVPGYVVLLENGATACPGAGSGPAFPVRSESDLKYFPEGAVLVAAQASPSYVMVMQKASAIIVNSGSITGHMASLSREFRVPTVLNLKGATSLIKKDDLITVDATAGRVYQGQVRELLETRTQKDFSHTYTPVYKILKLISEYINPLNLTDPHSPAFLPENCRTVHDIMRFIHERTYSEMFKISDFTTDYGTLSVKLSASLPIDLYVIDLGEGLQNLPGAKAEKQRITIEEVASAPFKAILTGMMHEGLAKGEPKPVDLKGFFSVMSEQMLSPPGNGGQRFGEKSYAIISDKYLNFSSRVGYHYSILDAYCSPVANMNYINFSFMGGAADYLRRSRRARLIQQVLQSMEFLVEVHGDRVTARFSKQPMDIISQKLDQLGRLLIFTRQMDMLMKTEQSVAQLSECFLNEDYKIKPC